VSIGPDAARYLLAAQGVPVPKPFHLRWLLPEVCGHNVKHWRSVWLASWPVMAVAMFLWRLGSGDGWQVALAASVLLLALPGILGPSAVIPVGVDLPATALTLVGCALWSLDHVGAQIATVVVIAWAAAIKETAPVFAALWLWSPLPLIALVVVGIRAVIAKPGPDPLGPRFQEIADHPIRSALEAHRHQWRNAWVMVAPWGVCLVALVQPDWRLLVVLGVAYGQLIVATDSVRLYQHAAGPVMAVAAAQTVPVEFLVLACVVHVVWWRLPERI
jgi:hypothetical protein